MEDILAKYITDMLSDRAARQRKTMELSEKNKLITKVGFL